VNLDNVGIRIGSCPKKISRATASFAFRLQISELPRPIGVKLCQMTENRWRFRSSIRKFRCPRENMAEATIGAQFSVLGWTTLASVWLTSPNLYTWCEARQGWKFGYKCLGACTLKIFGRTNWRDFGLLWIDRKYLRNKSRYWLAENGVINYKSSIPPAFDEKILINFGPLTTENCCLISTTH